MPKITRRLTADDPQYLHDLKAFLEGKKSWLEWHDWWEANRPVLQEQEGQPWLELVMENKPDDGAQTILERHLISFKKKVDYWSVCQTCGKATLHVIVGRTTEAEIIAFAEASTLPNRDRIMERGTLEPGVYCPNGCMRLRVNMPPSRPRRVPRNRNERLEVRSHQPGWVRCPNCNKQFSLKNQRSWNGERHMSCGQRLEIREAPEDAEGGEPDSGSVDS